MRKLIILLLCCVVFVSVVGCGDNTAPPPTKSPPTMVSEKIIAETSPTMAVSQKAHYICPTLTANMGTYPDRVPIILDDYGIRKITPYECLTLQGFPKTYRFPKIPMASAYKQCGNSVVVTVIRRIAENIMKVM